MSKDPYAAIARFYDPLTSAILAPVRRETASLCLANGWRRLLDLGCGTGAQMRILSEHGLEPSGLDASPAMLNLARQRLGDECALTLSDLPAPFAANSFEAVILALVLHESNAGSRAVFAEALRLAPRAVILEWRMPERNLDYPGQLLIHAMERLAGKEHYRNFRSFAARGWLRGLVRDAGAKILSEEARLGGLLSLAVVERGEGGATSPENHS